MKASRLVLFFACITSLTAVSNRNLSVAQTERQTLPSNKGQSLAVKNNARADLTRAAVTQLPLFFEANHGQTDPRVRFLSRGSGYALFLTSDEAVLRLRSRQNKNAGESVLRIRLLGANGNAADEGLEEMPGKANYFIGNDPAKWRSNIPTYARANYQGIYPGIDLVYYGNQGRLENDFVIRPGADPTAIRFAVEGAVAKIDRSGDLLLQTPGGEVRLRKPLVYQGGENSAAPGRLIEGRYVLSAGNQVGFELSSYDSSKQIVIDPVLIYSTYLGGSGTTEPTRSPPILLEMPTSQAGQLPSIFR